MQTNDIKEIEKRIQRYWYTDGIAELAGGVMFILLGLYFGVQGYAGENSFISAILQVSLVLLLIAGAFGVRWLVNTMKVRLTYPRTGYVEYRVNEKNMNLRRLLVVGTGMLIGMVFVLMGDAIQGLESTVLFTGLVVGLIFIALRGRSSGLKRFYALGGLSIVLGVVLSFSGLVEAYTLTLFYGLLGIIILTSGALVLRRYLYENPLPGERSHE